MPDTGDRLDLAAVREQPLFKRMWQAVLDRCDDLAEAAPNRGTSRSSAMVECNGFTVSAMLSLKQDDGTSRVYHVQARIWPRTKQVEVSCAGSWTDSHDAFWEEQLTDRDGALVIGGCHYRAKPDLPDNRRDCAGFGGGLHRIRLADGEVIETRNLWHQGIIPPAFRDRLPDNAEFIVEERARLNLEDSDA